MNRLQLIDIVKMELGHPVVTLFVTDEQINNMIIKAVSKCQSKACPTFTHKGSVVGGKIFIGDLGIETVKNVYSDLSSSTENDVFGLGIDYPMAVSDNALMDAAVIAGKRSSMEKMMLYDYYIDGDYLYLDNYNGVVTLEYIKKEIEFEDLDNEWGAWVESYVGAMAKVIEGRIRGKYKSSGGPFEVESDNLVSEGTSTIQELESKLDTSMGYFNILR